MPILGKSKALQQFIKIKIKAQEELYNIYLDTKELEKNILSCISSNHQKHYYCYVQYNNRSIWYWQWVQWISKDPSVFKSMHIYVLPKYRGQWFGKKIKQHQITYMKKQWFEQHSTETKITNTPANRLLKSLWFEELYKEKGNIIYLLK